MDNLSTVDKLAGPNVSFIERLHCTITSNVGDTCDISVISSHSDFDNADALLISEVKMLLEHRKAQHESSEEDTELSNVFLKTLEHCQTFSKYNSRETIAAVRT